jgi:hypothetical protein
LLLPKLLQGRHELKYVIGLDDGHRGARWAWLVPIHALAQRAKGSGELHNLRGLFQPEGRDAESRPRGAWSFGRREAANAHFTEAMIDDRRRRGLSSRSSYPQHRLGAMRQNVKGHHPPET